MGVAQVQRGGRRARGRHANRGAHGAGGSGGRGGCERAAVVVVGSTAAACGGVRRGRRRSGRDASAAVGYGGTAARGYQHVVSGVHHGSRQRTKVNLLIC